MYNILPCLKNITFNKYADGTNALPVGTQNRRQ